MQFMAVAGQKSLNWVEWSSLATTTSILKKWVYVHLNMIGVASLALGKYDWCTYIGFFSSVSPQKT